MTFLPLLPVGVRTEQIMRTGWIVEGTQPAAVFEQYIMLLCTHIIYCSRIFIIIVRNILVLFTICKFSFIARGYSCVPVSLQSRLNPNRPT